MQMTQMKRQVEVEVKVRAEESPQMTQIPARTPEPQNPGTPDGRHPQITQIAQMSRNLVP